MRTILLFLSSTFAFLLVLLDAQLGGLVGGGVGVWIVVMGGLSGERAPGASGFKPARLEPSPDDEDRVRSDEEHASETSPGLLAGTVHELKSPLLGIRELSRLLLQNESLSPTGRRHLELIFASSADAMEQVDGLLSAVTGVEEETRELEWEALDLGRLAEEVVDRHHLHAEYKQQSLQYEFPEEMSPVQGDRFRIREAAANLVSNALKYSPPKTTITVRVHQTGDTIRLSVSDRGPGLSEADQDRLFQPFQSLSPQPTGVESSSGMGLYVTRQIMTLHGGEVDVATEEGEGSTFTLVFPINSSSAAP